MAWLVIARKRPGRSLRAVLPDWPRVQGWRFFLETRGWRVDVRKL